MRRKPNQPISETGLIMMKRWADPEYRKKMVERQKERWQDPEYRKRMMHAMGFASERHLSRAEEKRLDAIKMEKKAKAMLREAARVKYEAALMEKAEYEKTGSILVDGELQQVGLERGL